ncbi:uncharacterized protein LOC143228082 [Tachypleus tridentatus]|uniref:uncharacterized protein LOC143228082 n=1 Tax=Tachypleus tridentatus TaxID=6853 RepID=UPI003FD5FFCE
MKVSVILVMIIAANIVAETPKIKHQYAVSFFRNDKILQIESLEEFRGFSNIRCLELCNRNVKCKAFNFGHETCTLLPKSLCDTSHRAQLTDKVGYNYFDLLQDPQKEEQSYGRDECRTFGRCAPHCIPGQPAFYDEKVDRNEADKRCRGRGQLLVMPKSRADDTMILNLVEKARKNVTHFYVWIGVTKDTNTNAWVYDDTTFVGDFQPWGTHEPQSRVGETCVGFYLIINQYGRFHGWMDSWCDGEDSLYPYICA